MAYQEEREALVRALETDERTGLSTEEARRRLEERGANELAAAKPPSLLRRVALQLKDPMILVLLAAAGVSLWAGGGRDWLDSAIILLIVIVNAALSISQEDSAQKALGELRKLSAPLALCRRDGALCRLEAARLVPGDIIYIEAGDQAPADGRLLDSVGLRMDESAMTGESVPAEKEPGALPADTPLADRTNMVLSGTLAVAGRGTVLVTATGMDTEMGRIAGLLAGGEEKVTPLQQKMTEVSKSLSFLCLSVCAVMFGIGAIQGRDLLEMFLTAVSLAVAAIPEGLPAIVTIVLALGVSRLAREGAIVTKLPAVETLGCAGVICSDKTGTLTRNRMEVREVWTAGGAARTAALTAFALCSDARLPDEPGEEGTGDPTELALLAAAEREGLSVRALNEKSPRLAENPFDARRKRMSTLHRTGESCTAYVKGAPDLLLARCERILTPAGEVPLTPTLRQKVESANRAMGRSALRVLAAARREFPRRPRTVGEGTLESGLTFLGLAGMLDPPRPEVREAVAQCHRAGIRPVMITGDHKSTAVAVARALDILRPGEGAVTGEELDFMDQSMLESQVESISVFARVTPEHKSRIVRAWQARGQVVAMTGDGVNDAPALDQADMGVAMGKGGTQVARSAADLILTDDNFATIVSAVAQGRGVYANIKKAIHYLLSCNIGEVLTLFVATLLRFGSSPLTPVQLLWLNLVTDSLPALALGVEAVEPGAMDRPPRSGRAPLFDRPFTWRLIRQGCMVGALTLGAWCIGDLGPGGGAAANTMAFATLTLSQLFHAFNVRSEDRSIFALGVFSNAALDRAFLIGLAMQLAVLLVPPLREVFGTVPLTGLQWGAVAGLSMTPVAVCEGAKLLKKRSSSYCNPGE